MESGEQFVMMISEQMKHVLSVVSLDSLEALSSMVLFLRITGNVQVQIK